MVIAGDKGNDTLSGGSSVDRLEGGLGDDTLQGNAGNDMLLGGLGYDVLQGGAGDDLLYGEGEADTLDGGSGNDVLDGGAARDTLIGGDGNDTLAGNTGNDVLQGGNGANVYLFGRGWGKDTIVDSGYRTSVLRFGSGIAWTDLLLRRQNDDMVIAIKDTADQVTVKGYFNYSQFGAMGRLEFADGTVKLQQEVDTSLLQSSTTNDVMIGYDYSADTLAGGKGNDILQGGDGNDIYQFASDDGQDTVYDYGSGDDTLQFGTGITQANISFRRSGDDLLVNFANNASDRITIQRQFNYTNQYDIRQFQFADGTTLTKDAIASQLLGSTSGNDNIQGYDFRSSTLQGGLGNDYLNGGTSTEVYAYAAGDGRDIISDSGSGNILLIP